MAWPHVFAALSTAPMSYLDDNFNAAAQTGTAVSFSEVTCTGSGVLGNFVSGGVAEVQISGSGDPLTVIDDQSSTAAILIQKAVTSGFFEAFQQPAGTTVGSITTNGASTSYNTTSDAALKTVYGPADGTILSSLPVHDCSFTADPNVRHPMIIAQECAAVCPWAISAEADTPAMIDYSKLVATLIAYTQSLEARISVLEGLAKVVAQAETALAAAAKTALATASALPVVQAAIARGKGGSSAPP